jgi:hypothetical protein
MALTVEDLYRQYTGREPDPSGKAFWEAGFGSTIDANEVASFINAVAQARAQGTEPTATTPLATTSTTATSAPTVATAAPVSTASTSSTPTTVANQNPTVKLYQDTLGRTPSQSEIDGWNFGSTIDAGELNSFLGAARNEVVNTKPTTGAVGNIAKQILAQGTTDKWSGEGFGSAEKNAYDMAVMLAGQGITDINQFGKATIEVPTYGTDDQGNQIPSGTQKITQFVNKATGEPINSYYDRAGGDVWGGTFAGKGSTSYGVQFDEQGKPVFYSQYGGSTSDIGKLMPVIQLALAATGTGGLLGNALLGTGASQVAAGALGGGLLGGGLAAITGQDVLKGALTGGIGGAIAGYFSPSTGQITSTPVSADSVPFTQADYSLATGTQMNPLTDMGGAQGVQAGTSANLSNMGGGQGFTFNAGAPVTTLSELINAVNTMNGSYNPANLDAMGGGQGLTYQTPTGLVTQGGVIPTGGSTGNNNVIGETGINTAYNIGNGIGSNLAAVDTGVYNPSGGLLSSTVTGINPDGTPVTPTTTTPPIDITTIPPSLITAILGAVVAPKVLNPTTPTTTGVGALPTQGVPLNTADYYRAIQQNYNRLLPAVPRDVATPLAQWYNSTYGA